MAAGGKREGAGRKPKAQEEKAQNLIKRALKELYKKILMMKTLCSF